MRCFSGRNMKRKERRRDLKIASALLAPDTVKISSFFLFVLWLSLKFWNQRVPYQPGSLTVIIILSSIPCRIAAKPATTRRHQHVGRPRHLGCEKMA
ncbi:hypothetical protein V8C43DRAFT_290411 [Trichoderma afarasin]